MIRGSFTRRGVRKVVFFGALPPKPRSIPKLASPIFFDVGANDVWRRTFALVRPRHRRRRNVDDFVSVAIGRVGDRFGRDDVLCRRHFFVDVVFTVGVVPVGVGGFESKNRWRRSENVVFELFPKLRDGCFGRTVSAPEEVDGEARDDDLLLLFVVVDFEFI